MRDDDALTLIGVSREFSGSGARGQAAPIGRPIFGQLFSTFQRRENSAYLRRARVAAKEEEIFISLFSKQPSVRIVTNRLQPWSRNRSLQTLPRSRASPRESSEIAEKNVHAKPAARAAMTYFFFRASDNEEFHSSRTSNVLYLRLFPSPTEPMKLRLTDSINADCIRQLNCSLMDSLKKTGARGTPVQFYNFCIDGKNNISSASILINFLGRDAR